jgi:hypothetical protein
MTSSTGVVKSHAWTQRRSTYESFMRFRLASTACTMFLRWLPQAFGSPFFVKSEYFVATTKRSLSAATNSPTRRLLVPSVYRFAVSMKFPP